MDGRQPPKQTDVLFAAVEGVCGPQNTPMLWQCIIAGTNERFEGLNTLNPPKKYIHKLRGLSPIHSRRRCGAQGLMWGAWGPFPPAAAMVVAVVTPVVFCAMATEKCNDITKTSSLLTIILSITIGLGKTGLSPSLITEHFPGTVMDFTPCSLPPPLAFTFDLLPKSDDIVLFYFIYLHVSKSFFIYLPLLQTTFYVPHPCTKLLWRHFIKKDVTGRIYASITPHL
jgi:hypothetical protein